jgi:DNA (cytosine-5)-methyltransferase 1
MKYFSTFSGVEGFGLGMPDCECIGFSEINNYASSVLAYHYPNIKNYGNIKEINWSTVPDFDILVGGSPCQDLSIAGKRKGITGERSGLFTEFVRALQEKKPKYFIWENVKGALSSNQGWDFAEVQTQMAESGYELWWQVLNAKDFGVPQNRERIFIVGIRNECPREVFFKRCDGREIITIQQEKQESGERFSIQSEKTERDNERFENRGGDERRCSGDLKEITQGLSQGYRVYDTDGIATTIASQAGGMGAKTGLYAIPVLTPNRLEKRQNGRRFKEDGEPMFTLTGQDQHGVMTKKRIRRLMPIETERLMSWPDGWTKYGVSTGQIICYNLDVNNNKHLNVCKQSKIQKIKGENVKWQVVKESKKPTSVIVLCTINDGKEMEQQYCQTEKNSPLNTETVNVSIVKKKLENSEHWECVADITKCIISTETRYTLRKNVLSRAVTDTLEEQMEPTPIEKLWKSTSGENYDMTKLSITLTAINLIIESLISTFAHVENMRLYIKSLSNLSNKDLKWEVLNLEMGTIEVMSDSARYKMCGNGVVSKVVEQIWKICTGSN